MKTVYSPIRPGTAKDWSGNVLIEKKVVTKKQQTVDEYGNQVIKRLIVRK